MQLNLQAKCSLSMDKGDYTLSAIRGVCFAGLTDGLMGSEEEFSVCIEADSVTALGDCGRFFEIRILPGRLIIYRRIPSCEKRYTVAVPFMWKHSEILELVADGVKCLRDI